MPIPLPLLEEYVRPRLQPQERIEVSFRARQPNWHGRDKQLGIVVTNGRVLIVRYARRPRAKWWQRTQEPTEIAATYPRNQVVVTHFEFQREGMVVPGLELCPATVPTTLTLQVGEETLKLTHLQPAFPNPGAAVDLLSVEGSSALDYDSH